jgi:acyl-CoA synthetase (NDP forming)
MDIQEMVQKARAENRGALTEAESKQLLKHYGVPVVYEVVVKTPDEAVQQAKRLNFPVVLKGLGAKLTHKTERGVVQLDLKSPEEVRQAADLIAERAGGDLEGFLIQPMLTGRREFVAGLIHDRQFGPVTMFGLGGIFTEALSDVTFRVAPIDEKDASLMIDEIQARALLGPFRGEAPVNREQLVDTLVGLSRMGMQYPEISEVDINPLLVSADGQVTAVDALVVLGEKQKAETFSPPVPVRAIGELFCPRSIAFIGASAQFGKWGYLLFINTIAGGYKGIIYLVNSKGGSIAGRDVFKSVMDIPDPVDLAVVTIPAEYIRSLIPQLKEKKIKNMLLITSGFSEVGEEGRRLEERLIHEAREAGILVLGPNTMGICNPHESFFCMYHHIRQKPGSTALVAQSGNLGTQLLTFAENAGIGIRAFCGSGNEAMITIEDYMDAFEIDDLSKTVVLYLESIKNGRRFFESARRVSHNKPVVVLKGGRTPAGEQAAASHTGAIASNVKIFEAACRQAGIVLVDQPMDLLDASAAFSSLPLPKGKRVAIMTLGGGWGVITADLCVEYGLDVPPLSDDIIHRINQILPPYWSHANPVDLVAEMNFEISMTVLEELIKWAGCDAVLHMGITGRSYFVRHMMDSAAVADKTYNSAYFEKLPARLEEFENRYCEHVVRLMDKYNKTILGVNLVSEQHTRTIFDVKGSSYKGVSFFTPERAVKALSKMYEYKRWLDHEGFSPFHES